MSFSISFETGLPPQMGAGYLFWMWDGIVVEGTYWRRGGQPVITHYNMTAPTRPEAITQSVNKVRGWTRVQQARPE